MSIKFYAGGSCYKSWSGTNEAIKAIRTTTNLTEVCSKSQAMIPAQLETKEEAEQVNESMLATFNFPLLLRLRGTYPGYIPARNRAA